jgi:hypothetical protein
VAYVILPPFFAHFYNINFQIEKKIGGPDHTKFNFET